jgi:hypothetical protein
MYRKERVLLEPQSPSPLRSPHAFHRLKTSRGLQSAAPALLPAFLGSALLTDRIFVRRDDFPKSVRSCVGVHSAPAAPQRPLPPQRAPVLNFVLLGVSASLR